MANNTLVNTNKDDQNNSINLINSTNSNARKVSNDAVRGYVINLNAIGSTSGTNCGGINFSTLGSTAYNNFTWTCWINQINTNASTQIILSQLSSSTYLRLTTTRFLELNSSTTTTDTTTPLALNTWNFIALSFDNSVGYKLDLNGNLLFTFAKTTAQGLGNNIFGSNGANTFYGKYSTMLWFPVTLTQSQINSYQGIANY
jgi:hypothetical protein